jgi:serine/threonine-protein kinase
MTSPRHVRDRLQSALGDAYQIERELTGGGMSRLFLANEASLNRKVVIKLLPPEFTSDVSSARFKQEIEIAAHLQHPNILPVLNAGARDGLLFYVMPYVPGESLRHRLTREGKLPVEDALRILHEIADALAQAHAEGVIHRDIKPENILLQGRHAVLTDFGVARALAEASTGGRLTETGIALGTPGYMSPEQATGERNIDARADVYALAVVGYEMLAGCPPFEGPTAQAIVAAHLTSTPKPLSTIRPETPGRVVDAIGRALAKAPADRLRTAAEFRDALAVPAQAGSSAPGLSRRMAVAGALLIAVLVPLGWWATRGARSDGLDEDLLAVAPFETLGRDLDLWREGMVDVLSRSLNGAGPLRTVPATLVIRRWRGRADPASATTLGRSTGAGITVFGQILGTHGDSVKASATVVSVGDGRVLGEIEVRDQAISMDRVSDSLTVGVLRELGRTRPISSVRATAFRSTSLPALKAFLQGEQFFRRTSWDSALTAYRQAVTIDSTFALAWHRLSVVTGWQVMAGDSLASAYALKAAALNRGLPPRDSMLLTAESLMTALFTNGRDTAWRAHQARLFATLEEATRRFPEDPEMWYQLGDARVHFRLVGRTPLEEVLRPFDRAIALDSAFGESYIHPVEYVLQLGRPEAARRYIAEFLKRHATDQHAAAYRLVDRLLTEPGPPSQVLQHDLRSAGADVLFPALLPLVQWPDSQESAIRLARALHERPPGKVALSNDDGVRQWFVVAALAQRGHLKEAYASGEKVRDRVAMMAPLGGVPREAAATMFDQMLQHPPLAAADDALPFGFNFFLFSALPWWAANRDSISLAAFASKFGRTADSAGTPVDVRPWLRYGVLAARGYLALARRDTTAALEAFTGLPDTICLCVYDQVVKSQLLLARGRAKEALAVFQGHYPDFMSPAEGLWYLQRGRAYEQVGQSNAAADDYRRVVEIWRHADPELGGYVAEAREGLARLSREPRQ